MCTHPHAGFTASAARGQPSPRGHSHLRRKDQGVQTEGTLFRPVHGLPRHATQTLQTRTASPLCPQRAQRRTVGAHYLEKGGYRLGTGSHSFWPPAQRPGKLGLPGHWVLAADLGPSPCAAPEQTQVQGGGGICPHLLPPPHSGGHRDSAGQTPPPGLRIHANRSLSLPFVNRPVNGKTFQVLLWKPGLPLPEHTGRPRGMGSRVGQPRGPCSHSKGRAQEGLTRLPAPPCPTALPPLPLGAPAAPALPASGNSLH